MVLIVVSENSNRIVHVKSCFDRNDITVLDESEVKKKTGLCFNSWVGIFVVPFISCIILLSLCYFWVYLFIWKKGKEILGGHFVREVSFKHHCDEHDFSLCVLGSKRTLINLT